MKKLLALVLSLLMVASCFALCVFAAEETTAEGTTEEGTTEAPAAPTYDPTKLVFDASAQSMKILSAPNGIHKAFYSSSSSTEQWEGARLRITDVGDPYVTIQWNAYNKKAGTEKLDSQEYPFVVFKLKIEGYVEDFELFYCTGSVSGATPDYATTTDYPADSTGEIEYIIYDLTDDCEGVYNMFRFDPMGCDEDTMVYLYEICMFKTEDEALAYAGYNEDEDDTTEAPADDTTEALDETTVAEDEDVQTAPPANTEEEKKSCQSVIGVGVALVAMISLGAVCIKKRD